MNKRIPLWQQAAIVAFVLLILLLRAGNADFLYGDDTAFFKDAYSDPIGSIIKSYWI